MPITKKDIKYLELIDKMEPHAHCIRAHIACALVKNNKVLVKATNDWHKETPCTKIGCIRNIRKVEHGTRREICYGLCAEQWCVALAAKNGISIKGATAYVTKHPCRVCESLLSEAGIKRIVYQEGYPDVLPKFNILQKKHIKVEQGPNTNKKPKIRLSTHTI